MTKKKRFTLIIAAVLAVGIAAAGFFIFKGRQEDLPVSYTEADLIYDPGDLKTLVGAADYVFVGTVLECDKNTHYINHTLTKGDEYSTPYTWYTVQITENIKGSLQTDTPVKILKRGGVSYDGKYIELMSKDFFPEIGCTYVFSGFGQPSGDILVSGQNSNVLVEDPYEADAPAGIGSAPVINEFRTAFENEVVFERKRFPSQYEAAVQDKTE